MLDYFVSELDIKYIFYLLHQKSRCQNFVGKNCSEIVKPTHGSTSLSGPAYLYETVVSFSCDPGFNLTIDYNIICNASGVWHPRNPASNGNDASVICEG